MENPHSWIEISTAALAQNLSEVRRLVGDCCLVAPCVKGNAYGHGLVQTAVTLQDLGADGLLVFSLNDALRLEAAGISVPILILGYVRPSEAAEVVRGGFRVMVFDSALLEALSAAAVDQDKTARVHIKVDTGMSRFGLVPAEALELAALAAKLPGVRVEGVGTHFATSDKSGENEPFRIQLGRFTSFITDLHAQGITPSIRHCSNSMAVARYAEAHLDMVRPGRIIYGYTPSPEMTRELELDLQQVISIKTRVAQVRQLPVGTSVGYDWTFTTTRETTLAVLPIGYADGISRFLGNQGSVLIHGKRAPIRGKICMNIFMVDITDIPGVQVEDEVVILGSQGEENISTYEMAVMLNTLPYNVLTAFQDSLPRLIVP